MKNNIAKTGPLAVILTITLGNFALQSQTLFDQAFDWGYWGYFSIASYQGGNPINTSITFPLNAGNPNPCMEIAMTATSWSDYYAGQAEFQTVFGNTDPNPANYTLSFDACGSQAANIGLVLQTWPNPYFGGSMVINATTNKLLSAANTWQTFTMNLGALTTRPPTGATWQLAFQISASQWGGPGQTDILKIDNIVLRHLGTSLSLTSSLYPSTYGASVNFTATVFSNGSPATNATGQVVFSDAAGPFSTNSVSGGSATSAAITTLPLGTDQITATYTGGNYPGANTAFYQRVNSKQSRYVFTTVDVPSAAPGYGEGTSCFGISGTNLVGYYRDTNLIYHGFVYNSQTWTALSDASAGTGLNQGTYAYRMVGTNILGSYTDASGVYHGFLYNGSNWTALNAPQAVGATFPLGMGGANVVGGYADARGVYHGFIFNLLTTNWVTLDEPRALQASGAGTLAFNLSGTNIVGWYTDPSNSKVSHGFLYNGVAWTTLDAPGSTTTDCYDISGSSVVGYYADSNGTGHGYLYNILSKTWIAIDDPLGADGSCAYGVSGDNIVGSYWDIIGSPSMGGHEHGFLATPIPELAIELSTSGLRVSWPYCPLVCWTLEQNPDLSTTNWTPVGEISSDGTNNCVNLTPQARNAFFRLRR